MNPLFDTFIVKDFAEWLSLIPQIEKSERDIFIVDRATVPADAAEQLRATAQAQGWGICAAVTTSEYDLISQKGLSVWSAGRKIVTPFGNTAERSNDHWGKLLKQVTPAPAEGCESIWGSAVYITCETLKAAGNFDPGLIQLNEPLVPNLLWDDLCLRARLKRIRIGYDPKVEAVVARETIGFPDKKSTTCLHWFNKWGWDPVLPNLYKIRDRWRSTPLVKAILDDLLEPWPAEPPEVEAIMLTGNALDKLKLCLASLAKTNYPKLRIRILLNGSRKEVAEELARIRDSVFPFPLEWIHCPVNVGVPAGLNWLLSQCTAPVIARLDDDIELPLDWLEKMTSLLQKYPFCGAVMPSWLIPGKAGVAMVSALRIFPRFSEHDPKFSPPLTSIYLTNFLAGACVVYRKSALDRIGEFDLRFSPTQNEDTDHGIKLRKLGYDLITHGKVVGVHYSTAFSGVGYHYARTTHYQRAMLFDDWSRAMGILECTLDRDGRVIEP